jgi:hypothetical protein
MMNRRKHLRGTGACIRSLFEVPDDFFFRRFQSKLGREYVFKPKVSNKSFSESTNDNGVRSVNCHIKNIYLEYNIHKYTSDFS